MAPPMRKTLKHVVHLIVGGNSAWATTLHVGNGSRYQMRAKYSSIAKDLLIHLSRCVTT